MVMRDKRKIMGLIRGYSSSISPLCFIVLIFNVGIAEPQQDYFFPQQGQNRFIPSFQNPRNGFFPSATFAPINVHNTNTGHSNNGAPGSYQEQTLFSSDPKSPLEQSSSSFSQFQSTRNPDYFEISPRPFSVPQPAFNRPPQTVRSGINSFLPQKSSGRGNNVPHQQSQFLAHFNEQSHQSGILNEKETTKSNRRPYSSGGFSRNRPASGYSLKQQTSSEEIFSPNQQQLPYRNSRNRFQPSSERTTSTTVPTIVTSQTEKIHHYNRFGSGRTPQSPKESTSTSRTRPNKSAFQPRRPVFISREVNEPVHVKNTPFSSNKISIKHNGTDKNKRESEESISEQESVETNQQKNSADSQIESFEKLELHEPKSTEIIKTTSQDPISTDSQKPIEEPVILTSNFFLPDGSVYIPDSVSEQSSSASSSQEENSTTQSPHDYEYEYEDYEEKSSTLPTILTADDSSSSTKVKQDYTTPQNNDYKSTDSVESNNESTSSVEPIPDITTVYQPEGRLESNSEPESEYQSESQSESQPQSTESSTEYDEQYDSEGEIEDDEEIEEGDRDEEGEQEDDEEYETESEENSQQPPDDIVGKAIISVVTTKSVINGSTAYPKPITPKTTSQELMEYSEKTKTTESIEKTLTEDDSGVENDGANNATESWVVIASIQPSRSISGARFLPFPVVEQEEKKQTLSELERKVHEQKNSRSTKKSSTTSEQESEENEQISSKESFDNTTDSTPTTKPPMTTTTESTIDIITTDKNPINQSISTESIIDKLDRVQSELSSGLLSGKFPILNEMPALDRSTQSTIVATTSKFNPVVIRKFTPKTTSKPKIDIDTLPMDDLTGLLPTGFKPRQNNYRNKKITTTTESPTIKTFGYKPLRNSTIGRSFKNSPSHNNNNNNNGFIPKGYRSNTSTPSPEILTTLGQKNLNDLLSKIKFEDNLDKLLPKDYKEKSPKGTTTKKPAITTVDDISKFLPPGYKFTTTTTKKPLSLSPITIKDDISNILPPGFKSSEEITTKKTPSIPVIPIADDISKFLPPDFKSNKKDDDNVSSAIDISKLLPKDFKSSSSSNNDSEKVSLLKKFEFKDVSSLLPPDFKLNSSSNSNKTGPTTIAKPETVKLVFPKALNKRPGMRLTTAKTPGADGPAPPAIVIKKGPPTRATTEFTGWPTPSTTPISIEKLLEQQRTATIDISELLPVTTELLPTTTTTTTTTTEPPKPTEPGICRSKCDLAGTIKIVDGVKWKPELLDHNTVEWKSLASEVEAQLNEVYINAPYLNKWYRKVRIDSFNKGSVLVDYFVELANITREVDTLEIRKLFHEALQPVPLPVVPLSSSEEKSSDNIDNENSNQRGGEKLVKETFLLGRFVVDPISTDFIVIPKSVSPTVEFAEDDILLPQWAIVVIVIGVGSLLFVVIFGVAVLINRQKRSKKTPTPLTTDMLNELNKNHMGGVDNYGHDEFYNIDDTWGDTKQPIKPKRFTNSVHGSSASNIYDSWRSQRHGDYYYDNHNYTPHKIEQYPPPDAFPDAHPMYTYNSRPRYHRDYDPEF